MLAPDGRRLGPNEIFFMLARDRRAFFYAGHEKHFLLIGFHGSAFGQCDQHRYSFSMGSNEVHLWAWPVLVLPAVICAGGTVWWVQPHLAADRNSWTAVRRWIYKNMRKSKAPGDRRFCDFAYLAGFYRLRWLDLLCRLCRFHRFRHRSIFS